MSARGIASGALFCVVAHSRRDASRLRTLGLRTPSSLCAPASLAGARSLREASPDGTPSAGSLQNAACDSLDSELGY